MNAEGTMTESNTTATAAGPVSETAPSVRGIVPSHGAKRGRKSAQAKREVASETERVEMKVSEPVSDKQLLEEIRVAKRVAAERVKEAPAIIAGANTDDVDVLAKTELRLRQIGIIPDSMHVFWGDEKEHSFYISRGYVPVIEDGRHLQWNEVKLYMIPKDVIRAEQIRDARRSRETFMGHLSEGVASSQPLQGAHDPTARRLQEFANIPDPTATVPLKTRNKPTEPI